MIADMRRGVLIVDDHEGFRRSVRALLLAAGYRVLGEADCGKAGMRAVIELVPDVVLLDVQLPDITGFEVARLIREQPDPPTVILISTRDATDYGGRIDRSGARGFISKAEFSAGSLEAMLQTRDP